MTIRKKLWFPFFFERYDFKCAFQEIVVFSEYRIRGSLKEDFFTH